MRILLLSVTILWIAGASPAFSEVFNHAEHNVYVDGAACDTCHLEDDASIVPADKVCPQCHDQDFVDGVEYPALDLHGPVWGFGHRVAAKSDASDCAACHQQDFCLDCHKAGFADEQGSFSNDLANVHRGDFQVSHPIAARTDPQLCSSCHENDFCVDCHNAFAPADLALDSHRRGWSDITVSGAAHANFTDSQCSSCHPDSVLPAHQWSISHAREARKNLATCQACHPEGEVCLTCHSARSGLRINPHPEDWGSLGDNLNRASGGRTCRKCH